MPNQKASTRRPRRGGSLRGRDAVRPPADAVVPIEPPSDRRQRQLFDATKRVRRAEHIYFKATGLLNSTDPLSKSYADIEAGAMGATQELLDARAAVRQAVGITSDAAVEAHYGEPLVQGQAIDMGDRVNRIMDRL